MASESKGSQPGEQRRKSADAATWHTKLRPFDDDAEAHAVLGCPLRDRCLTTTHRNKSAVSDTWHTELLSIDDDVDAHAAFTLGITLRDTPRAERDDAAAVLGRILRDRWLTTAHLLEFAAAAMQKFCASGVLGTTQPAGFFPGVARAMRMCRGTPSETENLRATLELNIRDLATGTSVACVVCGRRLHFAKLRTDKNTEWACTEHQHMLQPATGGASATRRVRICLHMPHMSLLKALKGTGAVVFVDTAEDTRIGTEEKRATLELAYDTLGRGETLGGGAYRTAEDDSIGTEETHATLGHG